MHFTLTTYSPRRKNSPLSAGIEKKMEAQGLNLDFPPLQVACFKGVMGVASQFAGGAEFAKHPVQVCIRHAQVN